jgi:hypothetical protein
MFRGIVWDGIWDDPDEEFVLRRCESPNTLFTWWASIEETRKAHANHVGCISPWTSLFLCALKFTQSKRI